MTMSGENTNTVEWMGQEIERLNKTNARLVQIKERYRSVVHTILDNMDDHDALIALDLIILEGVADETPK